MGMQEAKSITSVPILLGIVSQPDIRPVPKLDRMIPGPIYGHQLSAGVVGEGSSTALKPGSLLGKPEAGTSQNDGRLNCPQVTSCMKS